MILLLKKISSLSIVTLLLASCNSSNYSGMGYHEGMVDFGEPNIALLKRKVMSLSQKQNEVLKITQFGDSHSAADIFTGHLRELLQNRLGDAGIGFIPPMAVSGQRHSLVNWKSRAFNLINSRTENYDFPMGGYVAKTNSHNAEITVLPKMADATNTEWRADVLVKAHNNTKIFINNESFNVRSGNWHPVKAVTSLPLNIATDNPVEIGGLWLQKNHKSGVILSSIATNGAQLTIWNKWNNGWLNELKMLDSDLVILEYGVNESFNENLNIDEYRQNLISSIKKIRRYSPKSSILLLSPPDTMVRNRTGSCENRMPPSYQKIKEVQYHVARQEKLLYWDWQMAMGGACSIEKWKNQALAGNDLVHLTTQGYQRSAALFYKDLLGLLGLSR